MIMMGQFISIQDLPHDILMAFTKTNIHRLEVPRNINLKTTDLL